MEDPMASDPVSGTRDLASAADASLRRLATILFIAAAILGGLRAWAGRFIVGSDGINYLDLGEAWLRGDWRAAVNAHWSPLYSWILGAVLRLVQPTACNEAPTIYMVNYVLYLCALTCFHFFTAGLLRFGRGQARLLTPCQRTCLPQWVWLTLGYALFVWCALPLMIVSPDLCVAVFIYLTCAILLRIRNGSASWGTFVGLGLTLGFGYLAKAPMFPLAFVFLACSLFLVGDIRRAVPRVALAFLAFVVVASPWVAALSAKKGRLTFGDSARLNYAWKVNGVTEYVHWQGGPPGSGTPQHPTRKLLEYPAIYEFGSPIDGTYPAWYDPSYWYEGVTPHFEVRKQLTVLLEGAEVYFHLFFHWQGGLIVGVLALYLLGYRSSQTVRCFLRPWFLLIPSMAGLIMYWPVFVSLRYVAPFMLVLWAALVTGVSLPDAPEMQRPVKTIVSAMLVYMGIAVFVCMVRPKEAEEGGSLRLIGGSNHHAGIAESLSRAGIERGTRVVLVGTAMHVYWARLAGLRIVAEVQDRPGDAKVFEAVYPLAKERILDALNRTGAEVVLAQRLPEVFTSLGWRKVDPAGRLWFYRLRTR